MQDFVVFMFTQLSNFIMWFDTIEVIGSITLLKLIIIVIIFTIIMKFLGGRKDD